MKKLNKLFAILVAVLGVSTLSAQTWTDVTSTYIKNPTLIANYYSTSDNTVWPVYTTGRNSTQHPKEWILHTKGTTNHNIGGAFFEAWASSSTEVRWTLFQDVTLPAGKYQLTGRYSTDQSRGLIRTVVVTPHHSYYSSGITSSNWGSWGAETVEFTIYEESQVRVGMISTNFAQCNGFTLTTSGAKQLLADEIATAPEDLAEAIATAQNVYDNAGSDDAAYRTAAKNLNDAVVAYNIENASEEAPVDMTNRIENPSFEGVGGATSYTGDKYNCPEWTYPSVSDGGARSMTHTTYLNVDNTSDAFYCFNIWNNPATTFTVSQTLSNMPAGHYKLSARYASDAKNTATLYLNSAENGVTLTAGTSNKNFVDGSVTYTLAADGNLTIGITSTAWYKVDDFKLLYLGADLTLLEEAFEISYTNLKALSTNNAPTAFVDKINKLLTTYETTPTTKKSLQTANAAIAAVVDAYPSITTAFASLNEFIALCTEYTQNSNANSDEVLSTFNTAITTATANGNAATTVDAINAAYNTLESARQTYAKNAVPVYPYPFDMTFMLPNTTFDSNTDGWTKSGGATWKDAGNVECYNTTFEFSMEYTGLNSGSWEIQVDAFYRYGGYNAAETAHNDGTEQLHAILYANNNTVAVKSIMEGANAAGNYGQKTAGGVYIPNLPSHCDTYFATGCYANSIATVIADGKLKVGIKKETTQGADWTIFDNFKLIYKGIDVTDLQKALSALITTADAIKKEKMGTAELTALTNALEEADTENTNADNLGNMISTLQSAYDAAVPSIDLYATVLPYITKAECIDASIATTYRNQYDNGTITETAETVFQELEVATYNYVTENFDYLVPLSDEWKSDGTHTHAATFYDEHWSGERHAYKNQHDGWGNPKEGYPADSWSIDFEQEVTLPAGEYVFKVAGRKSVDATLELVVTMGETELGTVNDFPNSNAGFGINKAGAASFDANDPAGFAVLTNDKGEVTRTGFGWQWRYVKFALADKATVKVAVHAETSKIYNWVSFGDYTLQMTEETYLNANKPNMDAISATASALVDTKPMGDDENTALKEALTMTYTTGAQMLAKMNALETAIANANAWRSTYNTEKGKLVAALERFEADYNDAENGALDYMNKERWATAIVKAQAAAVAKDNLTSHAILTTATTALTAALDAATVSIGEYAALKAAITEANALAGANIGDDPFQRPQSAADALATTEAQSIYDTAEADAEGVTTKTTALEEAITTFNNTALNAPGDALFNVIINGNEGYKFNGRTVTFKEGATAENYSMGYTEFPGSHYNQAVKFIAAEAPNCYYLSFEDADGTTYYIGTGKSTGFGSDDAQIRSTADQAKAIPFRIESSTQDGIYYVWNTVINKRIGGNGSDNTGLYTAEQNGYKYYNFNLRPAAKVTPSLNISSAEWATLILPFNAALPEDVIAYSCEETDGENLTLAPAESIVANTPYLVSGKAGTYNFSGYGLAEKDSYTDGLFVGTYVNYTTTANSNTYVLQNGEEGLAFYHVGEGAQPMVKAYRCYMIYEAAAGAPVFRIGKGTTGIAPSTLNAQPSTVIYDLMGRKVTTMMKGGMYIVNGKKVVIR